LFTCILPTLFLNDLTPLLQTALRASWLSLTLTPSGVTEKENATAEWASAMLPLRP